MEHYQFMEEFLRKFNYPLLEAMAQEQIADIFNNSNRCFLVSWALKLLDGVYEEALDNYESDKDVLSSFVYELGFCTKKECLPFMTGDLPPNRQVAILWRMFKFISEVKNNPKTDEVDQSRTVSFEELVNLKSANLNLFPMFGEIKTIPSDERVQRHKTYYGEYRLLHMLKAAAREQESKNQEPSIGARIGIPDADVVQAFENIKNNFVKIKEQAEGIKKKKACLVPEIQNYKINPKSFEVLKTSSDNIQTILQYVNDIQTIIDFNSNASKLSENTNSKKDEEYEELTAILTSLGEQSAAVAKCL